jgi:hypothetical protein
MNKLKIIIDDFEFNLISKSVPSYIYYNMNKHHTTDFKLSAVKLYLKLKSIRDVSELLD